jgi:excisionase family DNA binding protein
VTTQMNCTEPVPSSSSGTTQMNCTEPVPSSSSGERSPRRLIAERRIRFVRVGRHVRIPESAIADYVAAQTVEAIRLPGVR